MGSANQIPSEDDVDISYIGDDYDNEDVDNDDFDDDHNGSRCVIKVVDLVQSVL